MAIQASSVRDSGAATVSPGSLDRYDRRTVVLHWTTAALVVLLWLVAQVIDWFPQGPARITARSVHVLLGVALACVLAYRIVWRRLAGARLPSVGHPTLAALARIMHMALYALLVLEIVLGIANLAVRGDSLFNLVSVPSIAPGNRALRRQIGSYHEIVANTILVAAALHAAAALAHHYVGKTDVLRRMSFGRRRQPR